MNLIDRYVREIGRRLPQKTRTDIQRELRSALEDMLDDRSQKEDRPVDEEMTIQILKEYGKPEKVAASYMPERYLIGPELFPTFWLVLKIVFTVLSVLAIVGLGINLTRAEALPADIVKTILETFGQYFSGLVAAFGNIVLIFALIQRFAPEVKFDDNEDESWNPRDLPDVEESDQVSLPGTIAELVFLALGLIVFNLYPEFIGIYSFTSKGSLVVPFLSPAFFGYMPWINLLWGLQIGLNVMLIQQMRWQSGARWLWIAIKAGGIALAYAMLTGPAITNLTPEMLTSSLNFTADEAQTIASLFSQAIRWALIIAIIAGGVDIIKALVKLIRGQTATANP